MKSVVSHSITIPAPPVHVAIIMDGNGRWAQARDLPRIVGHRKGAEAVRTTVQTSADLGIGYLTLYGFSIDNWKRPKSEVSDLMGLLRLYLREEIDELDANGVRLRFIGERQLLAPDIIDLLEKSEERTRGNNTLNTQMTLVLALSYGGRQEIVNAAKTLAADVAAGNLQSSEIDEQYFSGKLQTSGIPDPDLLIRTSGEKRISNFMLWQAAYAELVFIDTFWPDFSRQNLEDAIGEFHRRERRFGAIGV